MKKLIFSLLTLTLALGFVATSHAKDKAFDARSAADVNSDGFVNILDLTFIASHFGEMPTADQFPNPDINRDGSVNILDLVLAANYVGQTSGIPFEVTDETFDAIVLGSELPIVVEFKIRVLNILYTDEACGHSGSIGISGYFYLRKVGCQHRITKNARVITSEEHRPISCSALERLLGRLQGQCRVIHWWKRILGILAPEETDE